MNSPFSELDSEKPSAALFGSSVRRAAALAFLLFLAGCFIFNRSFARIGFPPIYIGEMVLGLALLAALFDLKTVFIVPLKHGRALYAAALFLIYGIVRIAIDAPTRGLDAARDGVICLYAVAAFLGPWLLSNGTLASEISTRNLVRFIKPVSLLALIWGGGIDLGWIPPPTNVKVDFLALSAAVASCVWGIDIFTVGQSGRLEDTLSDSVKWLASVIIFAAALALLFHLPARALKPAVIVCPLVCLLALGVNKRRAIVFAAAATVCVLGLALIVPRIPAVREKIEALADPEDSHFKTLEGRHAAHSVKWRLVFWRYCIEETLRKSPLTGLGFGINLTDLMRGTPDWPMFEDSQNAVKYGAANRHPHSAHISVFTRLGILGLMIWLALLASVFVKGLTNCRRARACAQGGAVPSIFSEHYVPFWRETTILCVWTIYVLAMSFDVVLENPFGGIWFWTLTGVIANRPGAERSANASSKTNASSLPCS